MDDKKNVAQNPYRRPYGCGVLEVSSLLQANEDMDKLMPEEDLKTAFFNMPLYLWYANVWGWVGGGVCIILITEFDYVKFDVVAPYKVNTVCKDISFASKVTKRALNGELDGKLAPLEP